jgi:hypothetical protein
MLSSLSGLQCACDLSVRGRKKASNLLGECLIRGKPGKLALPKVEIAPGESIKLAGKLAGNLAGVVVFGDHASL